MLSVPTLIPLVECYVAVVELFQTSVYIPSLPGLVYIHSFETTQQLQKLRIARGEMRENPASSAANQIAQLAKKGGHMHDTNNVKLTISP